MAYDPQKAHEYYEKYRKKGLKKGRKRGRKKAATTKQKSVGLIGLSSSGLNEKGKFEAQLVKEKLKKEMNDALSKATSAEERDNIRREYQAKASSAIADLQKNTDFAKPQKEKKAKEAKTSNSKKSSSSSEKSAETKAKIQELSSKLDSLTEKINSMSTEQKTQVKQQLTDLLNEWKKKNVAGLDLSALSKRL